MHCTDHRAAVGIKFQSPYPFHTHKNIPWESPRNPHTHGPQKSSIIMPHTLRLFVRYIYFVLFIVYRYLNEHYFRCTLIALLSVFCNDRPNAGKNHKVLLKVKTNFKKTRLCSAKFKHRL